RAPCPAERRRRRRRRVRRRVPGALRPAHGAADAAVRGRARAARGAREARRGDGGAVEQARRGHRRAGEATAAALEVRRRARPGAPRKPAPQAALALAAALGLQPSECAFVGDTPIDVKTAVAAGMLPVAVLWGFRTKEELLDAGAKHALETPDELLSLL